MATGPVAFLQAVQIPGADTSGASSDSLAASLDRLGEGVTATGRLILEGRWDEVLRRTAEGTTQLLVDFVPNLVSAVFVGIFFYAVYRAVLGLVGGILHRAHSVDRGIEAISLRTLRVIGWSFIAVLVLSQLGINVTALVAGLGIAGLALGFAAKDSLENFIAGITILLDRPFSVGDWITVDTHHGKVTNITLRSTRIRTPSNQTVVFPSLHMVTKAVVNHTTGGPLRVDVPFGIAYKERIDAARDVVLALVDPEDPRLAPGTEPRVLVTGLNESSIDLELRVHVADPGDAIQVRSGLMEQVRNALGEAGIEIPFPHLQLFLDEARALRDTPVRVVREERGGTGRGEPG